MVHENPGSAVQLAEETVGACEPALSSADPAPLPIGVAFGATVLRAACAEKGRVDELPL
jgi:hypothetical protein